MSEESFAAALVGIVLDGRYRLDALLGEGGMGAVYRAHHLAMDRKVAVKLLKPHLASDDAAVQRFLREARSTMKVESDHAVAVLDFGITPQNDYYMVLEYLDGRTVQRELDVDGPFAPWRVIHIAKQALHALGAAHDRGLIHRDIKPDNILLMRVDDDPDYAKVLDFGVAKLMDGAAMSARSALAITQTGIVFGTPEYMSPEQACGQKLDARSDLYSLAVTMFAMLTGCGMYRAKTAIEWLTHHARTPPPHLADGAKELAPYTALDKALQRCLAKRREDRPQSAKEMSALLTSIEPTLGKHDDNAASSSARGHAMRAALSSYVEAIDPNATLAPGAPVAVGAAAATADSPYAKTMFPVSRDQLGVSNPPMSRDQLGMSNPPMSRDQLGVHSGAAASNRRLGLPSPASDAYARKMLPSDATAAVSAGHQGTPATAGHQGAPATTTGVIAEMRRSHRGVWLALGGVAVAAMVVAVIVVAAGGHRNKKAIAAKGTDDLGSARAALKEPTGRGSALTEANGSSAASGTNDHEAAGSSATAGNTASAGSSTTARNTASAGSGTIAGNTQAAGSGAIAAGSGAIATAGSGAATDSTTRTPPDSQKPDKATSSEKSGRKPDTGSGSKPGTTPGAGDKKAARAEVARLVAEADAAQRAGNRLKQIATADSALRLDPRNARATLLLADGLLATGDRDRGCKYLRDLGKNPTARARATQAGCPTD